MRETYLTDIFIRGQKQAKKSNSWLGALYVTFENPHIFAGLTLHPSSILAIKIGPHLQEPKYKVYSVISWQQ